jgi:hypothetical protein
LECKSSKIAGLPIVRVEGTPESLLKARYALADGGSLSLFGMPDPELLLPVRLADVYKIREKLEFAFPDLQFQVLPKHNLIVTTGSIDEIAKARKLLLELDRPE